MADLRADLAAQIALPAGPELPIDRILSVAPAETGSLHGQGVEAFGGRHAVLPGPHGGPVAPLAGRTQRLSPTIQSRGVQARAAVALADHVGAGKGDQLAKAKLPQRALETIADPEEGHAAHLAREGMVAVPRADVAAVFEGPGFRFEMGGGWGERNPADRG